MRFTISSMSQLRAMTFIGFQTPVKIGPMAEAQPSLLSSLYEMHNPLQTDHRFQLNPTIIIDLLPNLL